MDTSLVDVLLAHGAKVGDRDSLGNTILHLAARYLSHVDVARHLLSRGADVGAVNSRGNTALHEAAGAKFTDFGGAGWAGPMTLDERVRAQEEMMSVLCEGVPPDEARIAMSLPNLDGRTPLQIIEETRNHWRGEATAAMRGSMTRGRGRGRGRGCLPLN